MDVSVDFTSGLVQLHIEMKIERNLLTATAIYWQIGFK